MSPQWDKHQRLELPKDSTPFFLRNHPRLEQIREKETKVKVNKKLLLDESHFNGTENSTQRSPNQSTEILLELGTPNLEYIKQLRIGIVWHSMVSKKGMAKVSQPAMALPAEAGPVEEWPA